MGHDEEIKRIQNRVDFLGKAYLRCKSFFESEYGDVDVDGGRSDLELQRQKRQGGSGTEEMQVSDDECDDDDDVYVRTGTCGRLNTTTRKRRKLGKGASHEEMGEEDEEALQMKEKNLVKTGKVVAAVKQHLERVAGELEQIHTHLKAGIQTGSFQWIDSILIKVSKQLMMLLLFRLLLFSVMLIQSMKKINELNGKHMQSQTRRSCLRFSRYCISLSLSHDSWN